MAVPFTGGPLPLLPRQPTGEPDYYPTPGTGGGSTAAPAAPGARPRFVMTSTGPLRLPADLTDDEAAQVVAAWDKHMEVLQAATDKASGFQLEQLKEQMADAVKARQNAMEIAQLQAKTSRYGVDANTDQQLRLLKQQQLEFQANHNLNLAKFGLDQQRLGLDRARTATDFMSTEDRYAQAGNFMALSGRVMAGQPGAGTFGTAVAPRANTEADFAVLQSGGNPYANRGDATQAAGAGGAGSDARVKAVTDLVKASPPSSGLGHDANDFAVMNAARAIYAMNLTPQAQSTIKSSPEYQSILGSEIRASGGNPTDWWKRQQASLPGQGAARAA